MANFIKTVTKKRQEATKNNEESLSQVYKLVANSCYGRLGSFKFFHTFSNIF